MDRNPIIIETSPTLNLNSKPLALRLPAGAAVFGLHGTAWLTQEQESADVILTPGDRFDVKSEALILASAVRNSAVIHIVQPAEARAHVHPEVYDFARARAHQRMSARSRRSSATRSTTTRSSTSTSTR